jgi:hypothetical protein
MLMFMFISVKIHLPVFRLQVVQSSWIRIHSSTAIQCIPVLWSASAGRDRWSRRGRTRSREPQTCPATFCEGGRGRWRTPRGWRTSRDKRPYSAKKQRTHLQI